MRSSAFGGGRLARADKEYIYILKIFSEYLDWKSFSGNIYIIYLYLPEHCFNPETGGIFHYGGVRATTGEPGRALRPGTEDYG